MTGTLCKAGVSPQRSGYDWNVIVPHCQYPETVRCVYSPGFHQKERKKERKKESLRYKCLRHKLILIVQVFNCIN